MSKEQANAITLTVNNIDHQLSVGEDRLLLDAIREDLDLTGTKKACDNGECGSCIVMMNGKPTKSCLLAARRADGKRITTIEGMANADGSLSTIQQAFQDHHGLQCGFCTPGMVMSAAALLKENPKPTETEVREYLEGNICRCTGYHNIVKAIMAASGQTVTPVAAE